MSEPISNFEKIRSYRDREAQMCVNELPAFIPDDVCSLNDDVLTYLDEYVKMDGTYARVWQYHGYVWFQIWRGKDFK